MEIKDRKSLLKKKEDLAILLIFLFSTILRIILIIKTPYNITNHDKGVWPSAENPSCYGHLGYIAYIYRSGILPNFDPRLDFALYNPPLHHLVAGHFLRFLSSAGMKEATMLECLQILPFLYVSVGLIYIYRTIRKVTDSSTWTIVLSAFFSFHPFFFFTACFIGNDALALMFSFMTVYYAVNWFSTMERKDILLCALSLGLGMMTKLNVLLLAPALAYLFLVRLIDIAKNNKKKLSNLIGQYAIFAGVSIPIGTWWSFRNLIRFGVPLGYIDTPDPNLNQCIADCSFIDRIIPKGYNLTFPFLEFRHKTLGTADTSMYLAALKSSLFDQYGSDKFVATPFETVIAYILLYTALIVLALYAFFAIKKIPAIIKGRDHIAISAWIGSITLLVSYTIFCFKYPFVCSEDFRYLAPLFIFMVLTMRPYLQTKKGKAKED